MASRQLLPLCSTNISAICRPTGETGLSAVIGSWKIMAMRLPRSSRCSAADRFWISRPSNRMAPPPIDSGWRSRPIRASAVMLLPQPDSPTRPNVSPRSMRNETPSTAATWLDRVVEIDAQILDFDQRSSRHMRRLRDCGSRMSRKPSPSRLRPSTVRKIARPGKIESHGAVVIWSRASDSMLPQLG